MKSNPTKTYRVAVIERALTYYEVEAASPRAAVENWQDVVRYRDEEALDSHGPCSVRERQPDRTWRRVPESEWRAAPDLRAALTWLLDDIADAGEDRDPETGVEYDSVTFARAALARSQDAAIPDEPVAARLLAALKYALQFLEANDDGEEDVISRIAAVRTAIALTDSNLNAKTEDDHDSPHAA